MVSVSGYFGEENSVVKIKGDELVNILVATKSQDTTSVTSNDEQMFVNFNCLTIVSKLNVPS